MKLSATVVFLSQGQDRTMQHVESTLSGDDIVEDAANLDDFGRTMRSAQDVEQPEISRGAPDFTPSVMLGISLLGERDLCHSQRRHLILKLNYI